MKAIDEDDSEAHLERLEKEVQKVNELLQECRKRRLDIKTEIRSLVKAAKLLEVMMPKLQMEIEGCDTTREELTKLIPLLRAQCQISAEEETKRNALGEKVRRCQADMDSCVTLANRLEAELSKLQQEILDAGGPRLKRQRDVCEKTLSDLNKTEGLLNASKVEVSTAEKAQSKSKVAVVDLEKKLAACDEALEKKESEFKLLESGALEVMTAYEQVKALEAEKRACLECASKEADGLKKLQTEVRCREIDLLGQFDALEKQIAENRKKMQHWEKEITSLRQVDSESDVWEEYDAQDDAEQDRMDTGNDEEDLSGESGVASQPMSHSVLERYDYEEIKQTIATLEAERNVLAKNANMGAIAEYRKKEADYLSRYVADVDVVAIFAF